MHGEYQACNCDTAGAFPRRTRGAARMRPRGSTWNAGQDRTRPGGKTRRKLSGQSDRTLNEFLVALKHAFAGGGGPALEVGNERQPGTKGATRHNQGAISVIGVLRVQEKHTRSLWKHARGSRVITLARTRQHHGENEPERHERTGPGPGRRGSTAWGPTA